MVRRAKLTMFLDCTEATTVSELKKMIEGIAKKAPEDQKLFKDEQALDDNKTLGDYGFTSQTARPQSPAMIGLACKVEGNVVYMAVTSALIVKGGDYSCIQSCLTNFFHMISKEISQTEPKYMNLHPTLPQLRL